MASARCSIAHLLVIVLQLLVCVSLNNVQGRKNRNKQQSLSFISEPMSQWVAFDNSKTTLKCQATPASAEIQWLFNSVPFNQNMFDHYVKLHRNRVQLRLPRVSSSNITEELRTLRSELEQGVIQCVIKHNNQALISQPAKLQFADIEPFPMMPNETLTLTEGNIAVIKCSPPRSMPDAVTEFSINGSEIVDRSKGKLLIALAKISLNQHLRSDNAKNFVLKNTYSCSHKNSHLFRFDFFSLLSLSITNEFPLFDILQVVTT